MNTNSCSELEYNTFVEIHSALSYLSSAENVVLAAHGRVCD